jgi:hypothetical protein
MYVNPCVPTHPGTLIKVTPLKEAPSMPNATTYHGADLPARKNWDESSVDFDPVRCAMNKRIMTYPVNTEMTRYGFIRQR